MFEPPEQGLPGSAGAALQGGPAYRRRRTIYGSQAAILEIEGGWSGRRVGSRHGLKHHRPVFLTEPTVQEKVVPRWMNNSINPTADSGGYLHNCRNLGMSIDVQFDLQNLAEHLLMQRAVCLSIQPQMQTSASAQD